MKASRSCRPVLHGFALGAHDRVYAVRFGYFGTWPLRRLVDQLVGGRVPQLRALRRQFGQVLRVELPAYWETRG